MWRAHGFAGSSSLGEATSRQSAVDLTRSRPPVERLARKDRDMGDGDQAEKFVTTRGIVTGGVLTAAGSVLTFIGVVVGAVAAVASARAWVRQLDQPPKQVARVKWHQAKAAGIAGA